MQQHHQPISQKAPTGSEAVTSLSDQIACMKVQTEESATASTTSDHAAPSSLPPCPRARRIGYSRIWVHLRGTPGYCICECCYQDYIATSSLKDYFEVLELSGDPAVSCTFWIPRIKNVLWPEAVQTNSVEKLSMFLNRLINLKHCSPGVEVGYSAGTVIYRMSNHDIEGFNVCESCYELYVIGTAFENRFCRQEDLKGTTTVVCHMGYSYTSQSVARFAKLGNWNAFVEGAYERLIQPDCLGTAVQADNGAWLELSPGVADLFVTCKACYMDYLANGNFANAYVASLPPPGPDHQWTCALSQLSVRWALEAANSRQDHAVFIAAVRVISGLLPCTSAGIAGGRWFSLVRECPRFSICEGCYAGAIQSRGLGYLFFEIPWSPEELQTAVLCSFCPAAPRFERLREKLYEAIDTGNFDVFSDFAVKFARVPVCPRIGAWQNVKWWGYPGLLFCEECYYEFVAGTRLGHSLPINEAIYKEYQICQIWSPRMRGLWKEVCEAGQPGSADSDNALAGFKSFAAHRMSVYDQTIRQIEFLKRMQAIKNQDAAFQGLMSVQYQGIGGIASWGFQGDRKSGNNSIGWWDNRYNAEARRRLDVMHSGFQDAESMSREIPSLKNLSFSATIPHEEPTPNGVHFALLDIDDLRLDKIFVFLE
ncbi:integral membrane protein [Fusarium mundagurra]|uniref:Integral membrane protein n=1 Tax=Fusarium mundagurra TaxID=1567541 RepID=A0A8H6DGN0_9HYPO|nr:integral membrane protein [Fusarium mundagurra]